MSHTKNYQASFAQRQALMDEFEASLKNHDVALHKLTEKLMEERLAWLYAVSQKCLRKDPFTTPIPEELRSLMYMSKTKVFSYSKDALLITFNERVYTAPRKHETRKATAIFPVEWLSMSTWDFCSMVRRRFAEAKEAEEARVLQEKIEEAEELGEKIKELVSQLQQTEGEITLMKGEQA